jgi:hypothetical protein
MKKILTFGISLLFLHNIQAQKLVGKWEISSLIDNDYPPEEYILIPLKSNRKGGQDLILNKDGTFTSYRNPGCGQDRFPPSTSGKYTIIDENYISFFLERTFAEHETLINKDLGRYYYYPKNDGFNFIKSTGTLDHDKQIVYYRDLLSLKDKEIKQYENVLNWKQTTIKEEKEAVSFCLAENQIQNFEILYSKPVERYRQTIFLIKVGDEFRYVIYDKEYDRVALYDDYQINKINTLISDIDSDKKLKTKILKETYIPSRTSSEHNTITVYQKKEKIRKVVYNQYFVQGGGWFTTIYFENDEPIYVEFEEKTMYNQQELSSKIGCYIFDIKKFASTFKTTQSKALLLTAPKCDLSLFPL